MNAEAEVFYKCASGVTRKNGEELTVGQGGRGV
jgi:hypothetical protein